MKHGCIIPTLPSTIGFRFGPLVLILGFLLAAVEAGAVTAPGNPYEAIVGRNVFGLKPLTPVTTVVEEPKVPAPKIRLQGLTTILGRRQVLFKATIPAKPGEAARDQASVLSEGQREGEIEVLEINEVAGTVKFNNYGYVMTLNMKDDADKPAAGAAPAGVPQPGVIPPPLMPGLPTPASSPPPGVPMPMPRSVPPTPSSIPSRSLRTTPAGAVGLSGSASTTPQSQPLTHEEQVIMMEVEREQTKELVKQGKYPPVPPTPLTPAQSPPPPPPQK